MLARINIVMPIVKQIMPVIKIVTLSSIVLLKRKIRRKTFGLKLSLIPYHFYASLLANKGCIFCYCPSVVVGESGCIRRASLVELSLNVPFAFVHSCVHGRLQARALIGFTDNSRFMPQIQTKDNGSVLGL